MKFKEYMNEAKLQKPTMDKLKELSNDKTIHKYINKIVMYKKNDEGYGLARISAVNVLNDLVTAIGNAYEKGKKIDVNKEFSKKKYQKVTDPFNEWILKYAQAIHKHLFSEG